MNRNATESAIEIWRAGLDAVRSDRTVRNHIQVHGNHLEIAGRSFDADQLDRICVVGAGKAGAGMVYGLHDALAKSHLERRVTGWVNIPAGTEKRELPDSQIVLHAARPLGINEPTAEAVVGSKRIVELVEQLGPQDICICLLSGGGSALLPLPTDAITLEQKIQLTRDLSAAGATIQQLNAVRSYYSQIKAGGLARRCRSGNLVTLIISDVIGDPLDVIASGPTVLSSGEIPSLSSVRKQLAINGATESLSFVDQVSVRSNRKNGDAPQCRITNQIIANNQTAVEAAVAHARSLGFRCEILPSESPTTTADQVGVELAQRLKFREKDQPEPICYVSGGEPIVRLAGLPNRGKGGRNQQLTLAALNELKTAPCDHDFAIISGGTDGEDGPTDCSGAMCNPDIIHRHFQLNLSAEEHLARNDAYHFFDKVDGLFKTGPTGTNVCDLRVVVVSC